MTRWLTYSDLAALFGLCEDRVRRAMPQWRGRGFPAPLPWSRREKRWDADAVLCWKRREELRAQSLGAPELKAVGT